MIKLIATDLDGTFLNDKKEKPADFDRVFNEMQARGIVFAVASGRDYHGASAYFDGYIDKMVFLTDNGATIYKDGQLLKSRTLSRENYVALLGQMDSMGVTDIMVCTATDTYIQTKSSPEYLDRMTRHYSPARVVEDLKMIEDVVKVSVVDNTATLIKPVYDSLIANFGDSMTIHMSGTRFLDVMDKSADKGIAVAELQAQLGVSRDETMVFGDYYNDGPLLESATYAFVMENAPEDLKAMYPYRADNCNNGGVTKAIKEYAFDKIK